MAITFFYVVILLAILSQGMTSQTHKNTTECNAESCIFPERTASEYCSKALVFLDCINENIVDNKECALLDQEGGKTVIFLAKYVMLLQECPDVPGSYCELKQCTPPSDQDDDACQKAHDYQRCLVDNIIENNECALFEKGAAVSMLVMTGVMFPNCDEGEGHSWVEDNENAFQQATTVLMFLVQSNTTDTNSGPKNEAKFEHFGSELCDQELANKKEWKAFGPEWIKDVKAKPRPEGVEPQESVQLERDEILSKSDDTKRAGDEDLQQDFEQLKPDSNTVGEIKEDLMQFKPDSDTTSETSREGIKQFKPDSDTTSETSREGIKQFKPDSDTTSETSREGVKQFKPDSYRAGEAFSKGDPDQFNPDSFTTVEATKQDTHQLTQDSKTSSLNTNQAELKETCPAEPDARTHSGQALGKPLKFGLVKRDQRPKQESTISKMA